MLTVSISSDIDIDAVRLRDRIAPLAACASSVVLTLALSLVDASTMGRLFGHGSYYLVLAVVLAWAYSIWLLARRLELVGLLRRHRAGIVVAAAVTLSFFLALKPELRVLSDEANLVGVSKAMAAEHTAYHHYIGKWYYDTYHPQVDGIEKRPLLFPFLVNILHTATGYRVANAFVINGIAALVLLLLVYFAVRSRFHAPVAIASVLFVAAQPILAICATSAGFDLLAALFVGLAFAALHFHLKSQSADSLLLLWTTSLMLLHARYESLLFVAAIALFVVVTKSVRWQHVVQRVYLYATTPILLLPRIWQSMLTRHDYENPPGTPLFATAHLVRNLGELFRHQLDLSSNLPYALPLFWIAGVAAIHLLARRRRPSRLFLLAAVSLGLYHVVLLSHFMGKFTHPSQARFFLVLAVVVSVAASLFLANVVRLPSRFLVATAIAAFLIHHPIANAGSFMNAQRLPREVKAVLGFLEQRGDRRILLVSEYPAPYAIHDYSTTTFERARREFPTLRTNLSRHLVSDILVVQRVRYRDDREEPSDAFVAGITLESLFAFQDDAEHYTRISRVVN